MKSLVLALSLLLSIPAFAGHEGPEGVAILDPVIAKVVTGSGFAPPVAPLSVTVQIHRSGLIEMIRAFPKNSKTTEVATLAQPVALKLWGYTTSVVQAKLEDINPSAPECMDAPSTTYYAVQGWQEVEVAMTQNCKEFRKANESDADREVKRALDAALELSMIAR